MHPVDLQSIAVSVYRVPIATPVETSFGVLKDRAAVVVQAMDTAGVPGWGEIWCNFPAVGAEYRARLLMDAVAPLVLSRPWSSPTECHAAVDRATRILALQSGEPGPLAQIAAGVDIALWDLVARKAQQPLWRLLGGVSPKVSVYASGLNPTQPQRLATAMAQAGHTRFKLKVGIGAERDETNLAELRSALGDTATLMVDANQAWDLEEAARMSQRLARFGPIWLEEPIAADAPLEAWQQLARRSPVPLAAGENLRGADFGRFLASGALKVLQPDVAKWGGFSGCLALGAQAAAVSAWLCPHWLGGGIGLRASLHLKAAIGGAGCAEVDANPNPLRDLLAGPLAPVHEGAITLGDAPGLGVQPDFDALNAYLTLHDTEQKT